MQRNLYDQQANGRMEESEKVLLKQQLITTKSQLHDLKSRLQNDFLAAVPRPNRTFTNAGLPNFTFAIDDAVDDNLEREQDS